MADLLSGLESERHQAGGRRMMPLPPGTTGDAVFGGAREEYRYRLGRYWAPSPRLVLFVMMNPSTADPLFDDPTVYKCCKYARRWGYGGLLVGNTFAYRATDQAQLMTVADPIGPDNDAHLVQMAKDASLVVFAYGTPHVSLRERGPAVAALLARSGHVPHIIDLSTKGVPVHPLYQPDAADPIRWNR